MTEPPGLPVPGGSSVRQSGAVQARRVLSFRRSAILSPPQAHRRLIPIGTSDMQEIIEVHQLLDHRIEHLTSGDQVAYDPHATPESMKVAVAHASNRHDLRLLRLYERYLSIEFTPHAIKKVLAAVTGHEEYEPENTLDADYQKVTTTHLDAYRRVLLSLGAGHPAWTPMAQAAARYPHIADQLVEYAVKGTTDPKEAVESIGRQDATSPASEPISPLMDVENRPSITMHPSPVRL